MIDPNVLRVIQPKFITDEKILWAGRPQTFILDRTALLICILICLGAFVSAKYFAKDMNSWGPFLVLAFLVFIQSFFPNFDHYVVTTKHVFIQRGWPLMASAKINRLEIKSVSKSSLFWGRGITIAENTKFPSFWPFLRGSNLSFAIGFWERHWYTLYHIQDVDWVYEMLNPAGRKTGNNEVLKGRL